MNGSWYRVAGVLAAASRIAAGGADGTGREVYLPIAETLEAPRSARSPVEEIWLRIDETVPIELAARIVGGALLRRHEGSRVFEVLTPEQLLRQERAARGLLDALLAATAVAALAFGGVTMTSLAWHGVAERKSEIAIRRAVGARREEILAQFLLEAGLLASFGGGLGLVVGALAAGAAATVGGWPWLLSPQRLALAWGVAVGVGLAAAARPAQRAAGLDPVAALRFER
jgi:putative ABC transport system permease protein